MDFLNRTLQTPNKVLVGDGLLILLSDFHDEVLDDADLLHLLQES